ncbi:MAG: hypothetical protein IPJ52_08285 [Rhodocyclaceae bacterium]|mgnify:CR=1 FL=1|nr:hypothetical protein [Rhodocyclaceae bacterium]
MTDSTATTNPTGGAEARRRITQPALHDDLMEAVLSPANLKQAWRRVKANRGAPGIDGLRIEDFPAHAREHWPAIRQTLREGRYQPQPVRRVCYWKQWRLTRTKIGHLLALGVGKRTAILTGISSKSYWHLARSKATQVGMTNEWLKAQGLVSIRDLWMKAHGYA